MATPSEPQAAVLLAHVVNQIQLDVTFLESQHYLSTRDAATMRDIIQRIPKPTAATVVAITEVKVVPQSDAAVPARALPPAPTTTDPPKAGPVYARALWAYNEDRREPNDLSFSAGDMIQVLEETNEDWWKGRANGREALFPANYVEKVDPPAKAAAPTATTQPYHPFGAALHGTDTPPAAGGGVNSIGLQQSVPQPENKNRLGKYGNTLAHSAAGGLGFGTGAAIGGGLVRAIF